MSYDPPMSPTRRVRALSCKCYRCGHVWLARSKPIRCAKCKKRSWNSIEPGKAGRPKSKP